jgi:hypothetical protein
LGIDASLFHNKLDIGINAYINESYDLLLSRDISSVFGSKVFYDNTGKISGKGLEFSFRANPIHTKDFDFVLAANISTLKSTVKSLGGDKQSIINYTGFNDDDAQVLMAVDKKPYEFYGFKTNGIYSTTAEAFFKYIADENFVEEHTALADSICEYGILKYLHDNSCDISQFETAPKIVKKELSHNWQVKKGSETILEFEAKNVTVYKDNYTIRIR